MSRMAPFHALALALALASVGCTTVAVDMRAQTSAEEAHTTIVYSGARGDDARFADYSAIEGSILDD